MQCKFEGVDKFDFREGAEFLLRVWVNNGAAIFRAAVDPRLVESMLGISAVQMQHDWASKVPGVKQSCKDRLGPFRQRLQEFEGLVEVILSPAAEHASIVQMEGVAGGCHLAGRPATDRTPPRAAYDVDLEMGADVETIDLSTPP